MRTPPLDFRLEAGRIRVGHFSSPDSSLYGAFFIQGPCGARLKIITSPGTDPESEGWEHVSVSCEKRNPNWDEMCFVKRLFWEDDELVIQFHPKLKDYVNYHPFCLHMWRHVSQEFPTPPTVLIGPKAPA